MLTRWVNRYKEEHGIPDRTRKQLSSEELLNKIKQLEHENKEKARQIALREKQLADERMKVEILKKSLHIFMEPGA